MVNTSLFRPYGMLYHGGKEQQVVGGINLVKWHVPDGAKPVTLLHDGRRFITDRYYLQGSVNWRRWKRIARKNALYVRKAAVNV